MCLGDHLFTVSFFLACLRFTDKSLCGGICLSYFYPMSCVDLLGTHPRNAALFEGPPPLDTRDLSVDWDTVIGKFFVLFIALGFGLQKACSSACVDARCHFFGVSDEFVVCLLLLLLGLQGKLVLAFFFARAVLQLQFCTFLTDFA